MTWRQHVLNAGDRNRYQVRVDLIRFCADSAYVFPASRFLQRVGIESGEVDSGVVGGGYWKCRCLTFMDTHEYIQLLTVSFCATPFLGSSKAYSFFVKGHSTIFFLMSFWF